MTVLALTVPNSANSNSKRDEEVKKSTLLGLKKQFKARYMHLSLEGLEGGRKYE